MKNTRSYLVDALFVLALFGMFAVSALVVVTIGADVYQHTVRDMSANYNSRTATAYITQKVRAGDNATSSIQITTLEGQEALGLYADYNGTTYVTYLYLYEGYLRELFVKEGASLGGSMLAAGETILELDALSFEKVQDNLLCVNIETTDGQCKMLYLTLHSLTP